MKNKNTMRVCKLIKIFKLKREESVGEDEERETESCGKNTKWKKEKV